VHTVIQGDGASGGELAMVGLSPVHYLIEVEVEAAFGPLLGKHPLSVEPILDLIFMINFGNISELGESIH